MINSVPRWWLPCYFWNIDSDSYQFIVTETSVIYSLLIYDSQTTCKLHVYYKNHALCSWFLVFCCGLRTLNLKHGPLAKYVKMWVAHAPRMPGTYSPPPRSSDPDMHRGTCVPHVQRYMLGSLTNGFLWNRLRENFLGLTSECANRNFTYLVRGPYNCPGANEAT